MGRNQYVLTDRPFLGVGPTVPKSTLIVLPSRLQDDVGPPHIASLSLDSLCSCIPRPALPQPSDRLETTVESPPVAEPPAIRVQIERVLESFNTHRTLSTEVNAAWQIMHAVICYGTDLQIETAEQGRVGALEYVLNDGEMRGMQLMITSQNLESTGRPGVKARLEPGSYIGQGHVDQWLAICAMAKIPKEMPIRIGDRTATIFDWAKQAQFDVTNNPIDEFSWTLIALTHYLPEEPSWTADGGLTVSWEDLVSEELRIGIDDAACGGTHRMAGIIHALRAARRMGIANGDVWQEAEKTAKELLASTKQNRGADGRLSSFYFTRAGASRDLSLELSSSGHVFEFAALAAEKKELSEEWLVCSAQRLCELLENLSQQDLECGALYHG